MCAPQTCTRSSSRSQNSAAELVPAGPLYCCLCRRCGDNQGHSSAKRQKNGEGVSGSSAGASDRPCRCCTAAAPPSVACRTAGVTGGGPACGDAAAASTLAAAAGSTLAAAAAAAAASRSCASSAARVAASDGCSRWLARIGIRPSSRSMSREAVAAFSAALPPAEMWARATAGSSVTPAFVAS